MKRRKIFRRGLNVLIGVIITLNASIACAEVYDGAGVYFMTDETVELNATFSKKFAFTLNLFRLLLTISSKTTRL